MNERDKFEQGLGQLARNAGSRSTMRAFGALHEAALADGELSRATKELMALAVSIVQQCDGCIAWHVDGALSAGATEAQIGETVGVAVLMGGGPSTYYGSKALAAVASARVPVEG